MAKKIVRRRPVKKQDSPDATTTLEKVFTPSTGPLLVGQLFGGPEIPLSTKYAQYANEYMQLAWVYAAAFAVATGAAIVPWEIWKGKPGEGELVKPDHKAVKLFEDPNDDMTWFDLLEYTISYMELGGNCYWEVARNKAGGGPPLKLYPLRPDRITIFADKGGKGVNLYRFKVTPYAKKHIDFEPEDMVHFFYFHPTDDWYGLSTLSAAAQSCLSERYTIIYNQNFFKNSATPAGYLHTKEAITKETAEELGRLWRLNLGGVGGAHKTPVMPKGLQYTPIGITPQDMQFLKQRKYNREEILSVFGVPPVKVGLLEQAKYQNYQLQEAAFYRDTIQPKLKKVAGKITKFLRREFEGDLTFTFDLSEFLTVDSDKEASRLFKLFGIGSITANEIIKRLKLGEPYDDGNTHYVSTAYAPVGEEPATTGERTAAGVAEELKVQMENIKQAVAEMREEADRGINIEED